MSTPAGGGIVMIDPEPRTLYIDTEARLVIVDPEDRTAVIEIEEADL